MAEKFASKANHAKKFLVQIFVANLSFILYFKKNIAFILILMYFCGL